LDYALDFFPYLKQLCASLYKRLIKKLVPWTDKHTKVVKYLKQKIKSLPYLGIPNPSTYMIIKTDVPDIGYDGILKQDSMTKK